MASITEGLKDMCNRIVGSWYSENTGQLLIFSLNDLLKMSPLIIIKDGKQRETEYGIGVLPFANPDSLIDRFYFDVGFFDKQYYEIISITKDTMILKEFWMIPDKAPSEINLTYIRKPDIKAVDSILQGLH